MLKKSSLYKLREYVHGIGWSFALALLLMGLSALLNTQAVWKTNDVFNPLFESLSRAATAEQKALYLQELLHASLRLLFYTAAAAIANGGAMYVGASVGQRIVYQLRGRVYEKLQTLSLSYFDRHRSGDLLSRLNNDTSVLRSTLGDQLVRIVEAPLIALFAIGSMAHASWRLTLAICVALPVVAGITLFIGRHMRRYSRRVQEKLGDLTSVAEETIGAIRVVKIFGLEVPLSNRYESENADVYRAQMKAVMMQAISAPFVMTFIGAALCATLVYGGHELAANRIQGGSGGLMAFILLLQLAGTNVNRLSRLHLTIQQAEAAAGRIDEILKVVPEITEAEDAVDIPDLKGHVTFEHVAFSYNAEDPVITDLSIDIKPGETIAIAGPSGAGKSTVANLVARLYDVSSGSVRIDGVDVRKLKNTFLKSIMGIVPQETSLFSATLGENIAFGKPGATREEVIEAAKAAHAHEFISALPAGYDTPAGERGVMLSGGQRQRIAMARALLRAPQIMILDEATSSLDAKTEASIHAALQRLLHGRTAIIIAHRLSTIRDADRILVIDHGRVVQQGSHDELMAVDGLYRRLYESSMTTQYENVIDMTKGGENVNDE